jgi:serpin B
MKKLLISSLAGLALSVSAMANSDLGMTKDIVSANNQFALDLYKQVNQKDQNIFFSPYSISSALTMTYEGAKSKTAQEMREVLHLPKDAQKLKEAYSTLNRYYNANEREVRLSVANALWANNDFSFNQNYFKTVEDYYDARVENLDFSKGEAARQTINNWVEEKTNQKIQNLIPAGMLSPDSKLVLTNAIYFKGAWSDQFDEFLTREKTFKLTVKESIKVPMMEQTTNFNYLEDKNMQMLKMGYKGGETSMVILLPKENITTFEKSLSLETLEKIKELNHQSYHAMSLVNVRLPKFKLESNYSLKEHLSKLGMNAAFNNADFSGMSDQSQGLKIGKVLHKAFIEIDESGTEAAAATIVMMETGAAADMETPKIIDFHADHPFVFIIQDNVTGNILFMGKVSDPRS